MGQKRPKEIGFPDPDVQLNSNYVYPERDRGGYVMSEADREYGDISGFRFGITSTGHRFKQSHLGRKARGDHAD